MQKINNTSEKEHLKELEDRTLFLETIIEQNPYSIQINDADGHTMLVNKAFLELFGSKPPKEYSTFNDPTLQKMGLGEEIMKLRDGKTIRIPAIPYNAHWYDPKYPDKLVYGRATFCPIMDEAGKLKNIVIMHEDITQEKKAMDSLGKMNKSMVGRELRMVELKKEIASLKKELSELQSRN